MSVISKIEIKNFLAFHGVHELNLPEGKSVLIYGENGSGKSSLYKAVEIFLNQDAYPNALTKYRNRWFLKTEDQTDVVLTQVGDAGPVLLSSQPSLPWVNDLYLASGFLSYREILRTHFDIDGDHNYFDLVINHILKGYKSPTSGNVLSEEWKEIQQAIDNFNEEDWITDLDTPVSSSEADEAGETDDSDENDTADQSTKQDLRTQQIADINGKIESFNRELGSFLSRLNTKAEELLIEFDNKATITLELAGTVDQEGNEISLDNGEPVFGASLYEIEGEKSFQLLLRQPLVKGSVTLFGQTFEEYQHYLNEARLSALALCIFLAAILDKPNDGDEKILFLDDVLIGLDMGNRQPVIRILQKHFADYQVFLTTYDRYWFEVARVHLQYTVVEMFCETVKQVRAGQTWNTLDPGVDFPEGTDDNDKRLFEKPLIKNTNDYLELAKIYFTKKDYPACGNYQRKWCEQFLKSYLQENYRLQIDSTDTVKNITKLDTLYGKLMKFYDDCGIELPLAIKDEFRLHRDTVLNPFSHDDLESPVYRQELERGFRVIEEFQKLKDLRRSEIAHEGDELVFSEPAYNYSCRMKVSSKLLRLVNHGGDFSLLGKFDVIDFTRNGTINRAPQEGMSGLSFNELCDKLEDFLERQDASYELLDRFAKVELIPQGINLRAMIDNP